MLDVVALELESEVDETVELLSSDVLVDDGADEEEDETEVVVGAELEVDVGVGVGVGVGVALLVVELGAAALDEPELPEEPSVLKVMILAFDPDGTVTTQKSAPPAPVAASKLDTRPTPLEGSIEHGRPLHPPPSHSIFTPKVGVTLESEQPVQIGL